MPESVSIGKAVPDFTLPATGDKTISLKGLKGQHLVLYFYPKDDTPGCTIEALEFTDLEDAFVAKDALVLGVSRDNCVSHGAFRDRHGISVQLLADIEGEMCEAYGVWQEREAHGERKRAILRSTFIIDRRGVIRHALYDVRPKGHAAAVLGLLEDL